MANNLRQAMILEVKYIQEVIHIYFQREKKNWI